MVFNGFCLKLGKVKCWLHLISNLWFNVHVDGHWLQFQQFTLCTAYYLQIQSWSEEWIHYFSRQFQYTLLEKTWKKGSSFLGTFMILREKICKGNVPFWMEILPRLQGIKWIFSRLAYVLLSVHVWAREQSSPHKWQNCAKRNLWG